MKIRESAKDTSILTVFVLLILLGIGYRFKEVITEYQMTNTPIENFSTR